MLKCIICNKLSDECISTQ